MTTITTASEKPATYNGDLAHLPVALQPLTEQHRWVCWKWELRKGKSGKSKWTKPPYRPDDPSVKAEVDDPATWGTYEQALARVDAKEADGFGVVLAGANTGAVDLDRCRDSGSGELAPWASSLCDEANGAYLETTVSGTGLRIIGEAAGPELDRRFAFDHDGAGVELYRNALRYITVSGLEIGSCPKLPIVDGFLDALFARYSANDRQAPGLDFSNLGSPQLTIDDIDVLIRNDGERSDDRSRDFARVVWSLAAKGYGSDDIIAELAKHPDGIGAKYAGRLTDEVRRCFGKWRSHRHRERTGEENGGGVLMIQGTPAGAAQGSSASAIPSASASSWPPIRIVNGEMLRIVKEAEAALVNLGLDAPDCQFYQCGGMVIRAVRQHFMTPGGPLDNWGIDPVPPAHLRVTFSAAAEFMKYDGRSQGFVRCDPPDWLAAAYLARKGQWKLPVLGGIVDTPFLRSDGSICEIEGYDAASGLLYKPSEAFPPIPVKPTREDARAALAVLSEPLGEFPFEAPADQTVALSGILTLLCRRSIKAAPLHAVSARAGGTGKGLLVNVAAVIAMGRPISATSPGNSEEELEKRISASLINGEFLIAIDNLDERLVGKFLCQCLTEPLMNIRELGFSRNVMTPMATVFYALGNNLQFGSDLHRRAVLGDMDAKVERPELREFKEKDLLRRVRRDRPKLVVAALTILRAWRLARARGERVKLSIVLGSFWEWSEWVAEALVFAGAADCTVTVDKVRGSDPDRDAMAIVLTQWGMHIGVDETDKPGAGPRVTVQQVIDRAQGLAMNDPQNPDRDFLTALLLVAESRGHVSNRNLGVWLNKVAGKVAGGLCLVKDGILHGYPYWKLVRRQ